MKPCCEPLLTAFTKWRGRKGAPSTIVTCPEDNQQLRHREHPLPLADLDGSGVARPVPNKRRSGRDDHRVSILKRPASAPAQPAKRVRVEPSLPADSGGAAGSGGVPADSGGAAGSGGGNSAAFTPPVAQDRCKARTWNNGTASGTEVRWRMEMWREKSLPKSSDSSCAQGSECGRRCLCASVS